MHSLNISFTAFKMINLFLLIIIFPKLNADIDKQTTRTGFYKEILNGVNEIPVFSGSGLMKPIADDFAKTEEVFAVNELGNIIMAATEYGNGRAFVVAHEMYYEKLKDKSDVVATNFLDNVKKWLCKGNPVDESKIFDLTQIKSQNIDLNFENYTLIVWAGHLVELSFSIQYQLLNYLKNSGALLAITKTSAYSNKPDNSMYTFLKDNMGILLLPSQLDLPENTKSIQYEHNLAENSYFEVFMSELSVFFEELVNFLYYIKYFEYIWYYIETNDAIEYAEDVDKFFKTLNELYKKRDIFFTEFFSFILKTTVKSFHFLSHSMLSKVKGPMVKEFPGDFYVLPELKTNLTLNLKTNFSEWLSTGYYLPAAVEMSIKVIKGDIKDWHLRIGAHTDDITNLYYEHKRFPVITISKRLKENMILTSPFGGLVYFASSKASELEVMISNVVEALYIDITIPETVYTWNDNKNKKPGFSAELAGKYFILTIPSKYVKSIKDPLDIIYYFDKVIEQFRQFRGNNPTEYRRERIVCDIKSSSYMHNGYPVVTQLDILEERHGYSILDADQRKKNPPWGIFHEIGHNMQRSEWTFDGCGEVTTNIFSLHATAFTAGVPLLQQEWIVGNKRFGSYFSRTPTYEDWKGSVGMALMTFVQLIKHFGWNSMHIFLSDYEKDIKYAPNKLPKTNQDKIDQWVIRYSHIVGRNIKPQFEMWGLPVSDSVLEHIGNYTEWCPKEEKDHNIFMKKLN